MATKNDNIVIDSYGRIVSGGGSPTAPPPTFSSGGSSGRRGTSAPAPQTQPVEPPPEPANVDVELPSKLGDLQLGGRVLDPETGKQFLMTQEGLRPIQDEDALRALEARGAVRDITQPGAFLELSQSQLGEIGAPIDVTSAEGLAAVPDPFQPATSDVEGNVDQAEGEVDVDIDDVTTDDMDGDVTMDDIEGMIGELEDAPEAPNLLEDFEALRSAQGIPALQASLTDINEQIREFQASARLGLQEIEGETAPLTILSRQQQELQRQAQEQLDFLGRRKQRIVDELNTKNQVVGQIMDLTQLDFENANAVYGDNFNRKLGLITLIKDYQTKEEQLANDEKDRALANWETLASFYENKGLTWDTLSPDQQATVESLAVKAGKPGLSQFIGANMGQGEIKSVTSRTDASGNTFFDVLRVGADGSVSVESVFRGQGGGRITPSGIDGLDLSGLLSDSTPEQQSQAVSDIIQGLGSAGEREKAASVVASVQNAKQLLELLDQGVKTGPIAGSALRGRQLIGASSEEQNRFNAATTAFTANFIKAISGAQVSDKERRFLMNALPSVFKQESVNKANIIQLTDFLKNNFEAVTGTQTEQLPGVFDLEQSTSNPALENWLEQQGL